MPDAWSMAVVCTVATSCWPRVLPTMSRPLDKGAWRRGRGPCPGPAALIVAVSDFSGLTSSAWALARAEARAPTDSMDRCMARLRFLDIEAYRAGLLAPCSNPVSDGLFGVLGNE